MNEDKAPESVWKHSRWRRSARRLWRTLYEKGEAGKKPLGLWLTDDTVAVARFDHVQAYQVTTGEPLWTWRPPGEQVVGLVSADVKDGVGVVLHYDDGNPNVERVGLTSLAVDTGEVVRQREQDAELLGYLPSDVAVGGGLVAAAVESWKADEFGNEDEVTLHTLDVDTGRVRYQHTLRDRRVQNASAISAQPFVAHLEARGARGRPRLLVLDTARKDAVTLQLPDDCETFGRKVAAAGDVLAVALMPAEEDAGARLGAFSMSSGELLWEWRSKGIYMVPLAHRGWLLALHQYGRRLSVLDPANGRVVARRRLREYAFRPLLAASGDVIAVSCGSPGDTRRLRVFRWR
ncbi:PQQ-binding-like beta-propeller repeat protein [Streptomyces hokutonensis]|uniref:outer membrane protein assembly factor BamB family protein n=1 Tax=Streptomyces hokutonensis TaxID=1306990 RepID=UPI0037FB13C1